MCKLKQSMSLKIYKEGYEIKAVARKPRCYKQRALFLINDCKFHFIYLLQMLLLKE